MKNRVFLKHFGVTLGKLSRPNYYLEINPIAFPFQSFTLINKLCHIQHYFN